MGALASCCTARYAQLYSSRCRCTYVAVEVVGVVVVVGQTIRFHFLQIAGIHLLVNPKVRMHGIYAR